MEQIASLLCGFSLCGLLLFGILLILPLQPASRVSQPLSVPKVQTLCQFTPEQLDRIEISWSSDVFSLVNYGNRFRLEGMEDIPLQEKALDALLQLLEHFPTGIPTEPPEAPPDLQITVTPVSGKTADLELFYYDENKMLVSDGKTAQKISSQRLTTLLQPAEYYIQNMIYQTPPSIEGSLTISGNCHPQPFSISYYYVSENQEPLFAQLTEPFSEEIPQNKMEEILEGLCNLQAESVLKIAPTEEDLQNYGLSAPFLQLHADFLGERLDLRCSRPSKDGEIFLQKDELPVIYMIQEENVPWLSLCPESISEEEIFSVDYDDCTTVTVTTAEKNRRFTKWDGTVLSGSQQIEESNFADFFDFSTEIIPCGIALREQTEEDPLLTLRFSYTNPEKAADVLRFYSYDEERLRLSINGDSRYLCGKEKAEEILHRCEELFG